MKSLAVVLVLSLTLSACATARTITPIVFQGHGFDQSRYQADKADCFRMVDSQAPGIGSGERVVSRLTGGTIVGVVAGAVLGGLVGSPGRGAALGAAIGGASGGLGGYEHSERDKQTVFHQAVTTCLTLKGYQVMGATGGAR